MNTKHLQLICSLLFLSIPLLITLKCTLNTSAKAVIAMTRGISARAEGVHHRCALTPFVWEVHANEGCKVHVYAFMQHNQYTESYHRCVSISKSVQEVMSGSIQLAEVVNQDSHLICSLHIF